MYILLDEGETRVLMGDLEWYCVCEDCDKRCVEIGMIIECPKCKKEGYYES